MTQGFQAWQPPSEWQRQEYSTRADNGHYSSAQQLKQRMGQSANGRKGPGFRRAFQRFLILLSLVVIAGFVLLYGIRLLSPSENNTSEAEIPEPTVPKLDYSDFRPGRIITDQAMSDWDSMDEKQIQDFLNKVGKGCRPGESTFSSLPCLKDYTMNVPSRPADTYCSLPYDGKENASAAYMIAQTSKACQINPKVLLVLLQKEQSLLTASSYRLVPRKYETATGYACPDNSQCDPTYFGLDQQLYYAARQFQRYRVQPGQYSVKAGITNEIKYSLDSDCGVQQVYVENWATAALYNYTPYTPNAATLAGNSDDCSQYGNLNFYGLYKVWFGDPGIEGRAGG
ncbi:MAG: hemagglutinin [Actinomycetaceae bacterium]|nr:hemagglutinin [Actinomycetaceae bacterium]